MSTLTLPNLGQFVKPELKRLGSQHYRVIELALSGNLSRKQIGEAVGMTAVNVANILDSQLGQMELSRRRQEQHQQTDSAVAKGGAEAARILDEASVMAAEKVVQLANGAESQKIQLSAAAMILERQGLGRAASIQPVIHLTADRIELLVQAFNQQPIATIMSPTPSSLKPASVEEECQPIQKN